MIGINGVEYPMTVKDRQTFYAWVSSIDRETETVSKLSGGINPFREVLRAAIFKYGDETSTSFAESFVCKAMAIHLFTHLIHTPKAKLIWRIPPEFDVHQDTIPSDLSQVMNRDQIDKEIGKKTGPISLEEIKISLGKEDWATDFMSDTIFPAAAPKGEWRYLKSYMRYALMLNGEAIEHPLGFGAR